MIIDLQVVIIWAEYPFNPGKFTLVHLRFWWGYVEEPYEKKVLAIIFKENSAISCAYGLIQVGLSAVCTPLVGRERVCLLSVMLPYPWPNNSCIQYQAWVNITLQVEQHCQCRYFSFTCAFVNSFWNLYKIRNLTKL